LICVGIGEEHAQKILTLRGLQGVEKQVRLARLTQRPNGINSRPHGGEKSEEKSWS
jgi:hypothetical protein